MSYQNPTTFENEITYIEFDRLNSQTGNDFITCAEWTDKWGEKHSKHVVYGEAIPAHIRLQIALQIAGDLVVAK
jgi:hypothetical protein